MTRYKCVNDAECVGVDHEELCCNSFSLPLTLTHTHSHTSLWWAIRWTFLSAGVPLSLGTELPHAAECWQQHADVCATASLLLPPASSSYIFQVFISECWYLSLHYAFTVGFLVWSCNSDNWWAVCTLDGVRNTHVYIYIHSLALFSGKPVQLLVNTNS